MKYFNPPRDNLIGKQKDIMDQSKKIAFFDKYWFWHGLWHSHQALRKQEVSGTLDNNIKRLFYLKKQIILHYFKNFFLFPFFLFKFLLPSFMKGKNNVWKNIKTIIKEKEFKPLRIAILSQFVFTLILTQLGILVYQYYTNPSRTATMFLTQTNWGGGASTTLSASHSSDQTGWSRFYSTSSADVNTSVAGEVSITPTLNSTNQTSDTDFNTWTKTSNLTTSSTGSTGRIVLLKPNGASCTQANQCSSSFCSGGLCATPPCGLGVTSTVYSGQTYNLVNIGTQCWFATNLNIGTMLANNNTSPSNNSLIEKWCYDNSTANCTSYGGLYTWSEANQLAFSCDSTTCTASSPSQGICPSGWSIPTNTQFTTLITYTGSSSANLRTGGSSGFNEILAGYVYPGVFYNLGAAGLAWTSIKVPFNSLKSYAFFVNSTTVNANYEMSKNYGLPVRCLKN